MILVILRLILEVVLLLSELPATALPRVCLVMAAAVGLVHVPSAVVLDAAAPMVAAVLGITKESPCS